VTARKAQPASKVKRWHERAGRARPSEEGRLVPADLEERAVAAVNEEPGSAPRVRKGGGTDGLDRVARRDGVKAVDRVASPAGGSRGAIGGLSRVIGGEVLNRSNTVVEIS
jgi:hypothetical protein